MSQFLSHMPSAQLPTECSAYYWWYMFLREAQHGGLYGPSHRLYGHFGDLSQEFVDWWEDGHSALFYDGFKYGVSRHGSFNSFLELADMFGSVGMETWMVSVRPGFSRKDMLTQFKLMLDEHGIVNTPGAKDPKTSNQLATYALHQRPNVQALKLMWKCVLARRLIREKGYKPTSYDIATIADISPANWIDDVIDTKKTKAEKKNRIGAIVSRHLKKADRLIANVSEGRFPDYS